MRWLNESQRVKSYKHFPRATAEIAWRRWKKLQDCLYLSGPKSFSWFSWSFGERLQLLGRSCLKARSALQDSAQIVLFNLVEVCKFIFKTCLWDDPQAQRVNWFEYECLHVKIRFVRFREIYEWLCSLTALMLHVIMINILQQTDNILGKLSVHVRLSLKKKNWCQVNRASEWSVRSDSGPWRWLKWLAIWWMTSRFQTCKDPILL